jgi:outer membrane protein assembly factor BamB
MKTRLMAFFCSCAVAWVVAACSPSQQGGSARSGKLPKGVHWAYDAGGSITSRPTAVGDGLVFGSTAGTFHMISRKDGSLKWKYDARADAPEAAFHHEPLVADDLVLAATAGEGRGHVYAFDLATGQVRWKHELGADADGHGGADGEVVRHGDSAYVVGLNSQLICLDLKTGRKNWEVGPVEPHIVPAAGPAFLYVAVDATRVQGLDPLTGSAAWDADLEATVTTSLMAQGDELFAGTSPFRMVRLDGKTGAILSRIALQGKPVGNPAAAAGVVSVFLRPAQETGDAAQMIIVLDTGLQRLLWGRKAPEEWTSLHPQVWGGLILAGDRGGELIAYSPSDGVKRWSSKIDQGIGAIGMSDDTLYLGTLQGSVYALTPPSPAPS